VLEKILRRLIRSGKLTIISDNGSRISFGEVPSAEPHLDVVVRLNGKLTSTKLAVNPDLYLGESYTDGALIIEQGTLWDLLDICGRNLAQTHRSGQNAFLLAGKAILRRFLQLNSIHAARRNVSHHYDLSRRLYEQFLDPDMQYSCAYFRDPRMSLAEAQNEKKHLIAAKLLLAPGQRVLDIGCGWGGLALFLARHHNVQVLGVTLSAEQLAVARERARQAGLEHRVRFEMLDYRLIKGRFDRIVSVGMFEHVGTPYYRRFFNRISELLEDDGVALVHSIGRKNGPGVTSAWIRKYIFPGGYIPALSEVVPVIERSGLWLTDIEILRVHYAETLRRWREQFLNNQAKLREIYDDRFCRMWEFYLACSEMTFRYGGMMVFQAQLARHIEAVPLTRDYIMETETGGGGVLAAE
jgi:cyclopropane-fatty-acyl-phospholipid synthase